MTVEVLPPEANSPLKLLVVDDDELNRRMMQVILKREGHQVECVSNGLEALNAVKASTYDVVLMDLQMPVMDGMEASRLIREWEQNRTRTFIVALTASYMPEKGRELYEVGIDNYIAKPFEISHLRHILQYGVENRNKNQPVDADNLGSMKSSFDPEAGLKQVGGDQELYIDLLTDFVQELPSRATALQHHLNNRDMESFQRAAHSLKGISASLGALQLSEYAFSLEKATTGGYTGDLESSLSLLNSALDRTLEKINTFLAAKGSSLFSTKK